LENLIKEKGFIERLTNIGSGLNQIVKNWLIL